MRFQGLSYDQVERKAIEAAAEDGKDRYIIGGDNAYTFVDQKPTAFKVARHITAEHAREFMSQEPVDTTQVASPNSGRIRRRKKR